jgi:proteic killer suppression protein
MRVAFDDAALEDLEMNAKAGFDRPQAVVRGFRKVMQAIRAADDERDLYALKGLRFEKPKGDRLGQCSLRLNDQWRLIVELQGTAPLNITGVIEIVDYH